MWRAQRSPLVTSCIPWLRAAPCILQTRGSSSFPQGARRAICTCRPSTDAGAAAASERPRPARAQPSSSRGRACLIRHRYHRDANASTHRLLTCTTSSPAATTPFRRTGRLRLWTAPILGWTAPSRTTRRKGRMSEAATTSRTGAAKGAARLRHLHHAARRLQLAAPCNRPGRACAHLHRRERRHAAAARLPGDAGERPHLRLRPRLLRYQPGRDGWYIPGVTLATSPGQCKAARDIPIMAHGVMTAPATW